MPRLIVVMPARNASATIAGALRSTLRGLPKDSRVVVWNDASTDDTENVVDSIGDDRIDLLTSPVSVGGGVARAEILTRTDSQFVANMDADDYSLPWRFRIQEAHIKSVDISFTATVKFGTSLASWRPTMPLTYGPIDVSVSLAFHNTLSHPSMYASRAALDEVGGYRDLRVAQDYDLWLRAAAAGLRLGRTGLPCVAYRLSDTQVSRQSGYAQRIAKQPEIHESYGALLDHLQPGAEQALRELPFGHSDRRSYIEGLLRRQLPKLSPVLRPYYTNLAAKGLLGPLA